ncbi:MAG TPA: peroxiredoxin-like family protein [Nannocystaceae bacterium]|nr:peroxiredoxin-like family protein [Nannocystaceae bacterium]
MATGSASPPRVSDALARAEVLDREGASSTLGEHWRDRPALLVFLRHFGCIACAEHVAIVAPRLVELVRLQIEVVFIGNGAPHFIDGFVARNGLHGVPVAIVTDPTLLAFAAAGLVRSRMSTFGPRALLNHARASLAGFRQRAIEGDNEQQGGVLLVDRDGTIVYAHRDEVAGDHAPMADVVDAALRLSARRAAV